MKRAVVHHEDCSADVLIARTYWERARGLLFRKEWHGGMLIPCNAIHTFGMRKHLDVYFLRRDGMVVRSLLDFPPCRISPVVKEAKMVLEVPSGMLGSVLPGTRLRFPDLEVHYRKGVLISV